MTRPKRPSKLRADLLDKMAKEAPANYHFAFKTLLQFPARSPLAAPCWHWQGGTQTSRPFVRSGKGHTAHPMRFFLEDGYRRICGSAKCVNPFHFIAKNRPPTIPRSPSVQMAEAVLEDVRPIPKTMQQAILMLDEDHEAADVVCAYRNLRQDGFL
jgi:hypothetical protein